MPIFSFADFFDFLRFSRALRAACVRRVICVVYGVREGKKQRAADAVQARDSTGVWRGARACAMLRAR